MTKGHGFAVSDMLDACPYTGQEQKMCRRQDLCLPWLAQALICLGQQGIWR